MDIENTGNPLDELVIYFYRLKMGLDINEILEEKLIGEQKVMY
jgi:hypothetical protein